jgi:hypothetical protein
MPTHDGFNRDQRLPVFLAEESEQQDIGKTRDRAVLSSRALNAGVWAAAVTALGIALLSVGIPAKVFADLTASITGVTASLDNKSALQPGADPSMPAIQHAADVEALPPSAEGTPAREEFAAASELADQRRTANSEPASDSLLGQFQAWAAEKDAQALFEPVQPVQEAPAQLAQDTPAEVAKDAPPSLRPMQERRRGRTLHNARAEMRPVHNRKKKVLRKQSSRVSDPPAQEARAPQQGQAVQSAPAPPFLQTFGWSN